MADALERSIDWFLEQQHAEGWWSGELETNVTMTAEQILLYRFPGIDVAPMRDGAIRHILGCQRSDGSWALYHDGPADLSTTIEAYVALKVLGVDRQRAEMQRALAVIRRMGGLVNARVFTKIWLALFGRVSVGRHSVVAARDDLLPALDAVQRLRLRLLGARHDRAAHDRRFKAADTRARRRRHVNVIDPGTEAAIASRARFGLDVVARRRA